MNRVPQDFYTIKIHNYIYKIYFISDDKMKEKIKQYSLSYEDKDTLFGLTVYKEQLIFINDNCMHERKLSTLMHELSHAFIDSFRIDISDEEAVCDLIGEYAQEIYLTATEIVKEHYGEED